MLNSTENDNLEEGEVAFVEEGDGMVESLIRAVVLGYEQAFNRNNEKNEVKFTLTITTHKVATPEGNKDIAYLRIDRGIRPKDSDEQYDWILVHQEMYPFKDIKERVSKTSKWKQQLFLNALARLTSAGLEYAELLRRLKNIPKQPEAVPESNLVITKTMPAPLSAEDEKYKDWLKSERAKEGLE